MKDVFKTLFDSTEKVFRFILPGGYFVLLLYAVHHKELPQLSIKSAAFVVFFIGPIAYLFYRQVASIIDDIILFLIINKTDMNLSDYKANLYLFIHNNYDRYQSYMYMKFASTHLCIMLSALTFATVIYFSYISPREYFLTQYSKIILYGSAIMLLVGFYNWIILHRIQHAQFLNKSCQTTKMRGEILAEPSGAVDQGHSGHVKE